MNNDNFLIEESDLEEARSIAKSITNPSLRNRAVANALAAALTSKYFVDVEVDTESGLYHITQVLEDLDISDVYVRESYIDVRFYFDDNELYVPKSHFDRNILPVAYMFVKLEEDIAGGTVTGFVPSASIDTSEEINGFYKINEDDLVSFYDIDSMIVQDYDFELPESFEVELFDFLDNKLKDKDGFYRLLLQSSEARNRVIAAAKAKDIFNVLPLGETDIVSENTNDEQLSLEENIEESLELSLEPSSNDFALEEIESLDEAPVEELSLMDDSSSFDLEPAADLVEDVSEDLSLVASDDLVENLDSGFELESSNVLELDSNDSISAENSMLEEFNEDLTLEGSDSLLEEQPEGFADQMVSDLPSVGIGMDFDEQGAVSVEENSSINNVEDEGSLNLVIPDADSISMLGVGEIEPSKDYEPAAIEEFNNINENEQNQVSGEDISIISESEASESVDILTEEVDANKEVLDEAEVVKTLDLIDEETPTADEEFKYTTTTTPSINSIDNESEVDIDDLENLLQNEVVDNAETELNEQSESTKDIDNLFNQEGLHPVDENNFVEKKKGSPIVPLLSLIILGVGGYFAATKFMNVSSNDFNNETLANSVANIKNVANVGKNTPVKDVPAKNVSVKKETKVAMPLETVENIKPVNNVNEGNAVSIPAIESNLDASILVSNLAVNWEVPSGYISNNSAKRYFTKIGKVIQLNLKTELLLLSKPPISNKITLDLEFNKESGKFVVKSILQSSGEKTVDDVIKSTVTKALDMKLSTNMSVFGNVSGNPVLVIRL